PASAIAEWVRNDRDRQVGIAEASRLRLSEGREGGRANRHCRGLMFRRFYTVVDTPRRAGSSVTRTGDDRIALCGDVLNHGIAGRNLSALAMPDDTCYTVIS